MSSARELVHDRFHEKGWELQQPRSDDSSVDICLSDSFRIPVWCFEAHGRRIQCDRPVQLEISVEEDGCFAECDRLHVFASGRTIEEALVDLNTQVLDFYKDYVALSQSDVLGKAARIRQLYIDHFTEQC